MDKLTDLPKTRKEAKELGQLYYFTGEPCTHGHIDKRRVHNHSCMACELIRTKRCSKKNPKTFAHKKHQKTMLRLYHSNQMPSWANKTEIGKMVIAAKSRGMVLDHIIPLRGRAKGGRSVCGLHCEANLQEMSYGDNDRKSFHCWEDMWEYVEMDKHQTEQRGSSY